MNCLNCNNPLPEGAVACPSCNTPVAANPAPNAAPTPAPVPMPMPVQKMPPGGFMKFLNFEIMITPMIMKIIFIVGSAFIILGTLLAMFAGGVPGFFAGLILGPIGLVFFRVFCEQLILFFQMHKELVKANNKK